MSWTNSGGNTIPGPTNGDDNFNGSPAGDAQNALGGNDFMSGAGGDDILLGGPGNDFVFGGDGNDTLVGGAGNDALLGGANDDSLTDAGGGEVALQGEAGNDTLVATIEGAYVGALGGALLSGGEGDDSIVASGPGLDQGLFRMAPTLTGDGGNDTIIGTDINDAFYGGDFIEGGSGDDSIIGGDGPDEIGAGAGNDTVVWRLGDGDDTFDGGADTDHLDLEGWTTAGANPWTVGSDDGYTTYTHGPSGAVVYATNFENVVCFAEGTRILTPRGEVPVETFRAGDLVVTPLAGRRVQPLRWVGHRRIEVAQCRDRAAVAPVLIRAGALGPGAPCRDMRVSPEHGLLLDGHLVPARLLVNGTSIVQETWCQAVTYWHLELAAHGVLVAEGALAELYLEDGNRHFFDNPALAALRPSFERPSHDGACAPVILDRADPVLAAFHGRRVRHSA